MPRDAKCQDGSPMVRGDSSESEGRSRCRCAEAGLTPSPEIPRVFQGPLHTVAEVTPPGVTTDVKERMLLQMRKRYAAVAVVAELRREGDVQTESSQADGDVCGTAAGMRCAGPVR